MLALASSFGFGASCRRSTSAPAVAPPARAARAVRLYFVSDLDGYLEPCGCQARPLGGIDRLAALVERESPQRAQTLFVATGNTFFEHPTLEPDMVFQERAKAERLGPILDRLQLAAYAPGPADFALGTQAWEALARGTQARPLMANVAGRDGTVVREAGGLRVAFVGVSDFTDGDQHRAAGAPATSDPVEAARRAVAEVRASADVVVVLSSLPRRIARNVAEVPGVDFVLAARESSGTTPPPEQIGSAWLLTSVDQGKGLGVLDLRVDGDGVFRDASERSATAERSRLDGRIQELQARIAGWEHDPHADAVAVAAQRARLADMQSRRSALARPQPPSRGRTFEARWLAVDPDVPRAPTVQAEIASYFRAVNDHNRAAYAVLHAPPAPPGTAHYVGIEACRECHEEAFEVWSHTPHARAYRTLADASKNFNLACVGCHVTGYRRPGGSEVVQNDGLRDVQCETCHGPGSAHADARSRAARRATIVRNPPRDLCATECHTHEHSDQFDYTTYLPRVLGPGHGRPVGDGDAGVARDAVAAP